MLLCVCVCVFVVVPSGLLISFLLVMEFISNGPFSPQSYNRLECNYSPTPNNPPSLLPNLGANTKSYL